MLRKVAIIMISVAGTIAVLAGLGTLALSGLASGMCGNEIITVSTSPDGKWDAVLFERNCGATTGFSSQISLLRSGRELKNRGGNVYVADGYPRGYSLNWTNGNSLEVSGTYGRRFKEETEFSGVEVTYD